MDNFVCLAKSSGQFLELLLKRFCLESEIDALQVLLHAARRLESRPDSHSEPVPLGALESVRKGEAVHLEQVEEGVAHHVSYAVVCLRQAAAKPGAQRAWRGERGETVSKTTDSSDFVCRLCLGGGELLVVAVAVGHGEDVAVEDAEVGLEGQDGVFALVVLPAAAVSV